MIATVLLLKDVCNKRRAAALNAVVGVGERLTCEHSDTVCNMTIAATARGGSCRTAVSKLMLVESMTSKADGKIIPQLSQTAGTLKTPWVHILGS
jgi:hypothetical protein